MTLFVDIIYSYKWKNNSKEKKKQKMSLIKIEKMICVDPFDSFNYLSTTIYFGLLIIGTFGNFFIIFLNPVPATNYLKKAVVVPSTFLSLIHLLLLYLNSFDFVNIDVIGNIFIESIMRCRTINIIYRSLLLLEPW
jgi:hypothetical protein